MALTPKIHRFCEEYLVDLNATQAAIRAGYSRHSAYSQAHDLLKKPEVQSEIERLRDERSERTKINADWVLTRLAAIAEADLNDLYDTTGELLPVEDWPMIWRQGLIAGVDVEQLFEGRGEEREQIGVVKRIKTVDRIRAIELIGKHVNVKAFEDRVAVTGLDALADRLDRASKRIADAITGVNDAVTDDE